MENKEANEHLINARRLHFQGQTKEAIDEYNLVLSLDPNNADALQGLRILEMGSDTSIESTETVKQQDQPQKLKTNFFVNQAKSGQPGGVTGQILKIVVAALGIGGAYGLYLLVTFFLNYDAMITRENVTVNFRKPTMQQDTAVVNVNVINLNPAPIKHIKIQYTIKDATDNVLKAGELELPGQVPAGDSRTFSMINLGALSVKGTPAKLSAQAESLVCDHKPKLSEKLLEKFKQAAGSSDKEALSAYEDLIQETEDFAPAYIGYGRALAANGKFNKAIEQYKKALALDSQNANAHYYMSVALNFIGDVANAKKEINAAYEIAPDDPEITWSCQYFQTLRGKPKNNK